MNSMFTKPNEPLSQSERIRNKRNQEIYKNRAASNDVCLDNNGNIKNVKNYETFMNTVHGYYECVKENPSLNQNCFNTYLDDRDDVYDLTTFTDLEKSRIDFTNYDDDYNNKSAQGRKKVKAKEDGTNTFLTRAEDYTNPDEIVKLLNEGVTASENFKTGINLSSEITYPYEKPGLCSEYVMQKIAYYDTSGNNHTVMVKDIKKKFPLTKFE